MTPEQHLAINTALANQTILVLQALGPLVVLYLAFLATRLHDLSQRMERNASRIDVLANNGGDEKIEAKVKVMQAEGKVPLPSITPTQIGTVATVTPPATLPTDTPPTIATSTPPTIATSTPPTIATSTPPTIATDTTPTIATDTTPTIATSTPPTFTPPMTTYVQKIGNPNGLNPE